MEEILKSLADSFRGYLATGAALLPKLVSGLVLLVVALVVAKLIERFLREVLVRVKFDTLLTKVGIDQALQRIGLRAALNTLIPRVVYFLLLILFARTASDALGLSAISSAIGSFLAYLPNLIAALLIMILGSAAAQAAGGMVTQAAQNAGIDFAPSLGKVVSSLILFVLGVMAIGQLQLDTEMVRLVSTCILAGFALAFGLSVGLGTREITRNIIAGFYARKVFRIGEVMEIKGETGVLKSITPTQVLLEKDGRIIAISNRVFIEEVVRQ